MPIRMRSRMADSVLQAGPIVQIIFAQRVSRAARLGALYSARSPKTKSNLPKREALHRNHRSWFVRSESAFRAVLRLLSVELYIAIRLVGSRRAAQLLQFTSEKCPWEKHSIELRADQNHERDHVHPDQQRYAEAEGSIEDAVICVVL